ncbi:MAG: hypothetical protein LRZ99_06435 [Desulfotomaculum sp.]|nr:hypothetical protein [Desulfotomaculum sp.]
MNQINEKYLVNEKGKRVGVLLDIVKYKKMLEELEELDAIRAFDVAKASKNEAISFEQAINEIEHS